MSNDPKVGLFLDLVKGTFRRSRLWKWGILLGLIVLAFLFFNRGVETRVQGTTFNVKRGPLRITVTESGNVEALESQEIKSEVHGSTKILSIVEEGYLVTEEDVKNKKVLVELDNADLVEEVTQREISYQSAKAAYTDAKEQYEIQVKQNDSDITAAELDVKFKRMDLEKFVGYDLAREILKARGIPAEAIGFPKKEAEALSSNPPAVDYTKFANDPRIAGEAMQKLRTLDSDILLADEDLNTASTQFSWTEKLYAEKFVTTVDLDKDRIAKKRTEIRQQSSKTAQELFLEYEFPKELERRASEYEEALRKLIRTEKLAVARLAQAESRLNSSEVQYKVQTERLDRTKEQIEKCTLRAERTGMVVYGGSDRPWEMQDRIREGAMVRERQLILTIPDMTRMAVRVKVHESNVKRVARGQKVKIRLESFLDKELTGEVMRVAVLPDSERRWMNPELKVYPTTVTIDGVYDWLRPQMSAKAEILVKELPDVLQVPIQAVSAYNGQHVCYVVPAFGEPERRVVEIGEMNDEFIEIRSGLEEGERVLLRSPLSDQSEEGKEPPEQGEQPQTKPPSEIPVAPAPAAARAAAPATAAT